MVQNTSLIGCQIDFHNSSASFPYSSELSIGVSHQDLNQNFLLCGKLRDHHPWECSCISPGVSCSTIDGRAWPTGFLKYTTKQVTWLVQLTYLVAIFWTVFFIFWAKSVLLMPLAKAQELNSLCWWLLASNGWMKKSQGLWMTVVQVSVVLAVFIHCPWCQAVNSGWLSHLVNALMSNVKWSSDLGTNYMVLVKQRVLSTAYWITHDEVPHVEIRDLESHIVDTRSFTG